MLFPYKLYDGLRDGSIDLTFRKWTRLQAKVGGRYRTGAGDLIVDTIDSIRVDTISDREAKRAGFADNPTMQREMKWDAADVVYRIAFHRQESTPPPPPPELDDATITAKLDRMDASSPIGPWTRATLAIIGERPEVRAADLADALGRERLPFKADVRKLKRLGLTESLEIGYRLSPRGRAYLEATS